ncbi:MAG: dockerin type I domain-containing protein [Candidatus Competibacteraceae bacterium]
MFPSNSFRTFRVARVGATFCLQLLITGLLLGFNASPALAAEGQQVLFSENFNSYAPGTCIGGPVWTQNFGCVAAIAAPHPGWDGNAVDGAASYSLPQGSSGAQITAPVANAPTTGIVELSYRAWSPTQTPYYGGAVFLNTSQGNEGVGLEAFSNIFYNNTWILYAQPAFIGSGANTTLLWPSPAQFLRDTDVKATLVLDYDAREFWARVTDGSTEWTTPKIPFTGAEITGIGVYEDDRGSRGLDVDDIVITSTASPAINPTKGGNVGTVTMSLRNLALAPDTVIRLSAPDVPDIVGQDTEVVSPTLTRTTFDLAGATPGARNVVVTPPAGGEVSLPNTFEVINGGGPLLAIDLVGHTRPRLGRDTNYLAVVRNIGFNDLGLVSLTVDEENEAALSNLQIAAPTAAGTLLNMLVGGIPPGGSSAVPFPYTPSTGACHNIRATAEPDIDCEKLKELIRPVKAEWNNYKDAIFTLAQQIGLYCDPNSGQYDPVECTRVRGEKQQKVRRFKSLDDILRTACDHYRDKCALEPGYDPELCRDVPRKSDNIPPPDPETSLRICPIMSWDPNEKVGPPGFGAEGYLSSSLPFVYTVYFENLLSASAAAQDVVVTDQLDADLDWTTFELGGIRFGDQFVEVPAGSQDFSTRVNLRPRQNLAVNIDAKLDPKTGLVTWQFKSVDPDTGGVPSDPAAGFLPPNKVPPEGEASVFFTVRAKEGAQTGTEIRNKAIIVFDVNPPIETGQWVNTVDNTKPQSKVLPLTSAQQSPTFQVQWAGTDGESGVREHTVYVSENGGPASVFLNNTTETSASFTGKPGSTYAFYSMAMDYAGNVEDIPQVPDTSTRIALPGDLNGDGTVNCADLAIVKASFGKRTGQTGFDPRADTNADGVVDIRDLSMVARQLPAGTRCS